MNKYGLALLIRKGMPTWIKTWISCLPQSEEKEERRIAHFDEKKGEQAEGIKFDSQVVTIMANIILKHHKKE